MHIPVFKRIARVLLLALFITCVGFWFTAGHASASASNAAWSSSCDSHNHDGDDCSRYRYSCHSEDEDHHNCYRYGYRYGDDGQRYPVDVSNNCDRWDPNTGYCLHWVLNFSISYPYSYDGNYDYYCGCHKSD